MIKHLRQPRRGPSRQSHTKGWGPERRARQAALIRRWQPWRHSTGPKTELGKARCALNGTPRVDSACALALRRARQVLRLAARNLATLCALKRAASSRGQAIPAMANPAVMRYSLLATAYSLRPFCENNRRTT